MQADRFTTRAAEAVQDAQRLATRYRNSEIAPPHLLLALLDAEDNSAVPILNKLSADVAAIRDRTERAVGDLPTLSGDCLLYTSDAADE